MTHPPAAVLGTPHLHQRTIDSTNARAQQLAAAGAPHGTLVSADEQTAGRGRQGRTWATPRGGALACSLVLRDPPPLLPHVAALAVADIAEALDRERRRALIKWPNDVLLDERKVAGILAEGRPQEGWVVLGIGINVAIAPEAFPPELRTLATSLGGDAGGVARALTALLGALEHWLAATPTEALEAYRARDALTGRAISWNGHGGTALGIADDGSLRVRADDGQVLTLDAGEVHLGTRVRA